MLSLIKHNALIVEVLEPLRPTQPVYILGQAVQRQHPLCCVQSESWLTPDSLKVSTCIGSLSL
jgi:hypothetical protein